MFLLFRRCNFVGMQVKARTCQEPRDPGNNVGNLEGQCTCRRNATLHERQDPTQPNLVFLAGGEGKGPGPCLREETTSGAGHIGHNSCDKFLSNPAMPQPHVHVVHCT